MFGSFGNTPNSNSAFGSNSNQQAGSSTPGGGLFGNANQPAITGSSAFGSSQQPQNTNPLFGSTQQGSTNGGGFGGTPAQNGGLFGSTPSQSQPQQGGLFGNTQSQGSSVFGSNASNQQQQGGGTSVFGNASNQQQQPGGGLFGNASNQQQTGSGGLFGNASNQQQTGGGGLFGNTNQPSTIGSNVGGGGFGNTSTNVPGTGLFGSSTNNGTSNTTSNTTSGLFGNTANTSTLGGSLFGQQKPANSLFGQPQSQSQPQQTSLFGGNTLGQTQTASGSNVLGGSTFGGSTLIGSTGTPMPQQSDIQSQFAALTQRIESIAQAWNANSPQCRFQHYFYNLVEPSQIHLYGRPSNATNDAWWQKAVRENPNPSRLVPVLAVGFDDLQKRVEGQSQQAAEHQQKLKELKSRIDVLSQRHQLSNASRLHRASALQTQLTHRVLKLAQHLHLLIPALRSSSIRPEEEALRAVLENIDEEIRRPGGMGRMRGKLNELWALVGAVNAVRERDRKEGVVEWAVVDEDGLTQIARILAEEQAGLAHLTKILQRSMKDLVVMQGEASRDSEDPDVLFGSTSTLRGNASH